jgi:hypothetical protein
LHATESFTYYRNKSSDFRIGLLLTIFWPSIFLADDASVETQRQQRIFRVPR